MHPLRAQVPLLTLDETLVKPGLYFHFFCIYLVLLQENPATHFRGFAIYFVNIQGFFFFICLPFQFFSIPESIKVALVQLHQIH